MVGSGEPSSGSSPQRGAEWATLLSTRGRESGQLEALEAELDGWMDVLSGTGSSQPGSDFQIEYAAAHNFDKTVWALQITVYPEPDGPKEDEDEDYEVRAEVDPEVSIAAALRVPPGTSDADAVDRLVALWEANGDCVADAVFEREDFSQPGPGTQASKAEKKKPKKKAKKPAPKRKPQPKKKTKGKKKKLSR